MKFRLFLDTCLQVACCGGSFVGAPEVFFEGDLQVEPAKDGVFREVAEPSMSWANKVQLKHTAGYLLVPSGKADCVEVIFDPGIGPFTAIIVLQIFG